jgi:putative membrane protein
MLINIGRLLMLCVWGFLILNLVHPFPRPLNIFVNVALIFTVLMHGMQLALLKSTLASWPQTAAAAPALPAGRRP